MMRDRHFYAQEQLTAPGCTVRVIHVFTSLDARHAWLNQQPTSTYEHTSYAITHFRAHGLMHNTEVTVVRHEGSGGA